MEKTKNRDIIIDILKGLGIIFMVIGHSGSPFTSFIYMFHMAIFFIASGYCYSNRKSDDLKSVYRNCIGKIKSLWIPYVAWMTVFSLLHNFFIKINVYTDDEKLLAYSSGEYVSTINKWTNNDIFKNINNAIILRGESQIGGALWFVAVLFEISIAYCVIDYLIKKIVSGNGIIIAQGIVAILLLALGYYCHLTGMTIAGLSKMCSYYCLFYLGYVIKCYKLSSREKKNSVHVLVFGFSFIILIVASKFGSIALATNDYVNPLYLLLVSLVGWQWIYELSWMIKQINLIAGWMVCFGQNTLMVVILHFLCFKIVNYVGVLINGWPLCCVAAFPILCKGGVWWGGYTIIGVLIPIGVSLMWKKMKKLNRQMFGEKKS